MTSLSAVIITFNEERNIGRCLKSLEGIVQEIVVIDSGSTDKTQQICESAGAKFIVNPFKGHIEQKNFALDQASNNWIISLDADEEISENLGNSIINVMKGKPEIGYSMNRLSNYCGKWIHHGSWYPDTKLRLFDRTKVRWTGINPHDKAMPIIPAKTGHLKGDLHHYSYYTTEEHVKKLDYFSTIAAKAYFEKGRKSSAWNIIVNPAFAFVRDYIFRAGFLDGYYGFLIAKFTANYTFQKYVKLKDLCASKSPQ
jgi:glycosyltransferase involved in cell wall biosynthesis